MGTKRRSVGLPPKSRTASTAPWREVRFIETQTGVHGGEAWMLTLECGHLAFRSIPALGPRTARVLNGEKPPFAPERVRCIHCELGVSPNPAFLAAKLYKLKESI
jgi:hypothetical protein